MLFFLWYWRKSVVPDRLILFQGLIFFGSHLLWCKPKLESLLISYLFNKKRTLNNRPTKTQPPPLQSGMQIAFCLFFFFFRKQETLQELGFGSAEDWVLESSKGNTRDFGPLPCQAPAMAEGSDGLVIFCFCREKTRPR